MSIKIHNYNGPADYLRVDEFLREHYQPGNQDTNWIQPAWEYMHSHAWLDRASLGKIGLWEDGDKIVAAAHYESSLGEAFFQFHPDYRYLCGEMLEYAEQHLSARKQDGQRVLHAFINDNDTPFQELAAGRGYAIYPDEVRPLAAFTITEPLPAVSLPPGFRLTTMAEDCDWEKIHRVLWRGFNHPGEPPAGELEERKSMQDSPGFRNDLKVLVEAPDGHYVSFCGMWLMAEQGYAYVEPVATDPDYRRMGLARAAVLEGIRRCAALGAKEAYVGSDQDFYLSIGFRVLYNSECWVKHF